VKDPNSLDTRVATQRIPTSKEGDFTLMTRGANEPTKKNYDLKKVD